MGGDLCHVLLSAQQAARVTNTTDDYRADYFLDWFSTFSEGQLNQEAHGCRQFPLHEFGACPADMRGIKELPGCLPVRLDHRLQGPSLDGVFYSRNIHAKIGLQKSDKKLP